MNHIDYFKSYVPWMPRQSRVGQPVTSPDQAADRLRHVFPTLASLMKSVEVVCVAEGTKELELLVWGTSDTRTGWLCPPPGPPTTRVYADHELLATEFGGIEERFNEPDWWLLNHNAALTRQEASHDAGFLRDYAWAFEEAGLPLQPGDWYCIAREANGNTTICNRESGAVLLFAPDHSYEHIQPWRGCPPYTLHEISGAPTFRDWVEAIATQWALHLRHPRSSPI